MDARKRSNGAGALPSPPSSVGWSVATVKPPTRASTRFPQGNETSMVVCMAEAPLPMRAAPREIGSERRASSGAPFVASFLLPSHGILLARTSSLGEGDPLDARRAALDHHLVDNDVVGGASWTSRQRRSARAAEVARQVHGHGGERHVGARRECIDDLIWLDRAAPASRRRRKPHEIGMQDGDGQCQDSCRINAISERAASSFSGQRWNRPAAAG